jgi:hypothetical protein
MGFGRQTSLCLEERFHTLQYMRLLENITLLGVDCVDINRLILAAEICCKDFQFADVKLLTSLPSNHKNVIPIPAISSIQAYSQFMISDIGNFINSEFVLIIQHDGFILNPNAWSDQYLNYDYIGAPLWWKKKGFIVGNGGFSLRSKKLLTALQQLGENVDLDGEPEDWFVSVNKRPCLESRGIKFAPVEVARQFSFEGNEAEGIKWNNQFGFHGLKWTDISKWLKAHPEYKIENPLDNWALGMREKFKENYNTNE